MASNPKRPAAGGAQVDDDDILRADDPRPQRVPQYPSAGVGVRRKPRTQKAMPMPMYDTEAADEEMQAQYGVPEAQHTPAFLYVERGPGAGQLLEVKQGSVVVGRASVSDLRLQHPSISRRHAQLRREGEHFYVKDLGSQNGTFVNKQRIVAEVQVHPGDSIAMGNALLRLRGPLARGERLVPPPGSGVNKARVETAVVARHSGGHPAQSNALKVAVFAGAVGFGLAAVLAVALVKTLSGPAQPAATTAAPAETQQAPDERSRLIDEAIKRTMAERAAEPPRRVVVDLGDTDIEPDVEAKANAPRVGAAPEVQPARTLAKATRGADDAVDARPEKASAGASRTQLLANYEKGDANASLEAAKAAGDKELIGKLSRFVAAYDAANDAMMANDGLGAIKHFQRALALDNELSSGWGKYGGEIRRQLSNLYVLVGLKFVSDGQPDKAQPAFEAALKHDPNNQRAKAQLEKLGVAAKSLDDAFDDETPAAAPAKAPRPRKAAKPAKAPAASAIDDAFGD